MRGAALLFLLAGCWTEARPSTSAPAAAPTAATATPTVAPIDRAPRLAPAHETVHMVLPRHSVWQGTYMCSQGLTAVRFVLDIDGAGADAMFEFGQHPDNQRAVPDGTAHLRGSLTANIDGTMLVDVDPFEWVNQPAGYFMVGVTATIDPQLAEMHGRMKAETCGRFDVKRVAN